MKGQLWFTGAVGFEAARQVSLLPPGHRSSRIHGHSFLARARAKLPEGWASFPGDEVQSLRREITKCVAPLDYQDLNKHLNQPTDENLAR